MKKKIDAVRERLTECIMVRLTPGERRWLRELANDADLSESSLVRRAWRLGAPLIVNALKTTPMSIPNVKEQQ